MITQEIQKEIDQIKSQIYQMQLNPPLADHRHNGFDTSKIEFEDINRKIIYKDYTIYGADAATAANYGVFCIVPKACVVTGIQEVHQTAGTDGSAVTLNIEKLTGTTALGSGSEILSTAFSLKATANTVQDGSLSMDLSSRTLAKGDRLALKDTGTLTSVANVTVKIELTVI